MGCSDFIILTQFNDTVYWYSLQCTAASRTVVALVFKYVGEDVFSWKYSKIIKRIYEESKKNNTRAVFSCDSRAMVLEWHAAPLWLCRTHIGKNANIAFKRHSFYVA